MRPKTTKRPDTMGDAPKPTLREVRYLREGARYDRAIQTMLRAARIADDCRRKLDRWDRENARGAGNMSAVEAIEAIGPAGAADRLAPRTLSTLNRDNEGTGE
jgi:hypothetical protein